MSDKDRLALILDVVSNSDKVKKNIAELQAAIAKHEDAREKAIASQAEAQQVINTANAMKSKISDDKKFLDAAKDKLNQERAVFLKEKSVFEDEKNSHTEAVSFHNANLKEHNSNVLKLEADKIDHEAQVAEALRKASKAEEDARSAQRNADKLSSEAEETKKEYNKKLDDLAALTQRK